jgi:hypothetical protein
MSVWEIQDNSNQKSKGWLTLTCDGKRVCDFFPYAKDSDPEWVIIQAHQIRDRMQGSRLMKVEPTDTGSVM